MVKTGWLMVFRSQSELVVFVVGAERGPQAKRRGKKTSFFDVGLQALKAQSNMQLVSLTMGSVSRQS